MHDVNIKILHGHIEMSIPILMLAILLALFTNSYESLASWLSTTLYVISALLAATGLIMMKSGGGGMGAGSFSHDESSTDESKDD